MTKDKSYRLLVDDYLKSAPDFAKPICKKIRELILKADPEISEEFKWSIPVYAKKKLVLGLGVFKNHVTLTFFQGALLKDPKKIFTSGFDNRQTRSVKFSNIKEVDEKILASYIKEAIANDAKGIKVNIKERKEIQAPEDFLKALKAKKLDVKFQNMSYTCRKEYVQWIESAKKIETREARIKKGVGMVGKGLMVNG
jgi:uncharacterized protein YdeI (YjbR/CyaY-like superfamily)